MFLCFDPFRVSDRGLLSWGPIASRSKAMASSLSCTSSGYASTSARNSSSYAFKHPNNAHLIPHKAGDKRIVARRPVICRDLAPIADLKK